MYEGFFGLDGRPFVPLPRADHYFPAASIEAARQTLSRCIRREEGVGMVLGPSGTGKTLLCHVLAEQSQGSIKTILLASGRMGTRRALFQAMLYGLGQVYRGMDEGELRLALIDYLVSQEHSPVGTVFLVDEAHALPLRLLEEFRALTNLVRGGQGLVRLVLAGGPILEERLASPRLESFAQRLVARCYLEPFSRRETEEYIYTQVRKRGGDGRRLFSPEACHAVHRATDGVPRLVNQVCDHAMVLAYTGGKPTIEPAMIEESWADLQQLPTPWNAEGRGQKSSDGVIEFGGLDDEPTLAPAAPPPVVDEAAAPPDEQVSQIQGMISELDEDFQPAGSIRPEVELVFDDPANPLCERFQQEELIVDRYSAAIEQRRRAAEEAEEAEGRPAAGGATGAGPRPAVLRYPPAGQEPGSDADEIVLEEDAASQPPQPAVRVAAVRGHAYRQLFARLRRSC